MGNMQERNDEVLHCATPKAMRMGSCHYEGSRNISTHNKVMITKRKVIEAMNHLGRGNPELASVMKLKFWGLFEIKMMYYQERILILSHSNKFSE